MAKETTGSKASARASAHSAGKSDGKFQDAVALLKADHRKVEELFEKFEDAQSADEKGRLVDEVCRELMVHTLLEEEIFYRSCREGGVEDELLDQAQVEHDSAKVLIDDLLVEEPGSAFFDAKVKVLSEYIKHHVKEEERGSGIFAKAKEAGVDLNALGQRIQARKQQLMEQAQTSGLGVPRIRSLGFHTSMSEEKGMMRRRGRERDDEGRFMSEDERYGNGGRGRRLVGRYEDDDEERYARGRDQRAWEERGPSRYLREDDDYRRGSRLRGHYEDDDYGSRHAYSRERDRGSWYGDPEGHLEATRRGWDERSGSRVSRYEDEDYRRSLRGRGYTGWYGDPEGHSRAAQRGWEERGARARYYDEDEGERSMRGRGRSQGGWFGDPERHAEASRRGWQHRD